MLVLVNDCLEVIAVAARRFNQSGVKDVWKDGVFPLTNFLLYQLEV